MPTEGRPPFPVWALVGALAELAGLALIAYVLWVLWDPRAALLVLAALLLWLPNRR